MIRRVVLLILSAFVPSAALATSGARALALPMSVRQMGMGDVSTAGHDILRAWSNPALLAGQETQGEVALGGASLFGAEASTLGLGGGWVLSPQLALGGLVQTYGVGFDRLDANGVSMASTLEQRTTAVGACAAWRQGPVSAGATLKAVSDSVLKSSVTTGAADLGAAFSLDGFGAGVSLRNIGGTLRSPDLTGASKDGLPSEVRIGAAYRFAAWRLGLGAEYASVSDAQGQAGAGAEWWAADWFAVRGGMAALGSAAQRPTLGLSAVFGGLSVDYALGAHPLGPVHRISLSYAFGPEPEEAGSASTMAMLRAARGAKPAGPRHRVAVAKLYASQLAEADADGIAELLRGELAKSARIESLDWDTMAEAVTTKSLLKKGCSLPDCGVKLGKQVNADYVVVGSVGKLMGRYFISARAVEVATGVVRAQDEVKGDTVDELEKGIKALAARLAKKLR